MPRRRGGSPSGGSSSSAAPTRRRCSTSSTTSSSSEQPDFVEAYLATAELALDKQDYALAAETLQKAPKDAAEDPRFHYLLARAFSDDDRARSAKALAEALKINPRHVDSLLLQGRPPDRRRAVRGGGEDRSSRCSRSTRTSPGPGPTGRCWPTCGTTATGKPRRGGPRLAPWATNPEVDHLIGRKLSQKYRFAEGAAYQRRALELDPDYLPAKIQLCQDLLRLGEEAEGWKLADEIFAKDGYNVVAYNLVTLRDRLAGFRTLEDDGFIVRMDAREADLYGPRVLALLRRAKADAVREVRGDAPGAGDRRDLPAEEGVRRPDVRPARGRRAARASASAA